MHNSIQTLTVNNYCLMTIIDIWDWMTCAKIPGWNESFEEQELARQFS